MGVSNNNRENKIYVNVVGGKLAIKARTAEEVSPDGTVAKTRIAENKTTGEKREVHEFIYDELSGRLEDIKCEKNETLQAFQYIITLDDVGSKYSLSIPADSKYGDSLAVKVPFLTKGSMVVIKPYDFEDKKEVNTHTGKPKRVVGVAINQDGEKVGPYYTKENPNGRPITEEGNMDEDEWKIYMLKLRKFYRNEVAKWAENSVAAKPETAPVSKADEEDLSSDLPF
jgi:hypothetical protein